MDFGTIEIVNDGTRAAPSWSVTSETQGYVTNHESLDVIAEWLYRSIIEEGNVYDGLCLDLGEEG